MTQVVRASTQLQKARVSNFLLVSSSIVHLLYWYLFKQVVLTRAFETDTLQTQISNVQKSQRTVNGCSPFFLIRGHRFLFPASSA
jgi:hypothetical protein